MKLKLPPIPEQPSAYAGAKARGELESGPARRALQETTWSRLAARRLGAAPATYLLGSRQQWTPERLSITGRAWAPKREVLNKVRGDGTVTFKRATGLDEAEIYLSAPHHKQMFDSALHDFLANILRPPGGRARGPIDSWAFLIQAQFGAAYEGDALTFYAFAPAQQDFSLHFALFSSPGQYVITATHRDVGVGDFVEINASAPRLREPGAAEGLLAVGISPGHSEGSIEEVTDAAYVLVQSDRERSDDDD